MNSDTLRITPFLLFDGNCAEAMTFYHECLGGELTLTKLNETPMKAQFPQEKHDRIIYAQLNSGLIVFSATDWMAAPKLMPKQGNMFGNSPMIYGKRLERIRGAPYSMV